MSTERGIYKGLFIRCERAFDGIRFRTGPAFRTTKLACASFCFLIEMRWISSPLSDL